MPTLFESIRSALIALLQPAEVLEPCFEVGGKSVKSSVILAAVAAKLEPNIIKTADVPTKSGGNFKKRFITARNVMDRLDAVAPGLWEFRHEFVQVPNGDKGQYVVRGSLTICGVTREDTGMNDSFENYDPAKAATSDALKRCAVQFGYARELYGDEQPAPPKHWTNDPVKWRKFEAWFSEQPNISMDQVYEVLGNEPSAWPDMHGTKAAIDEIARPF